MLLLRRITIVIILQQYKKVMRRLIKLRRFKEFLSTYVPFEFSDVNLSRDAQFDAHQSIVDPTYNNHGIIGNFLESLTNVYVV